jgi:hypothetical protein
VRSGPQFRGPDRILGFVADSKGKRLSRIRVASEPARYRLLEHATRKGPFLATEAARIAGLNESSGTARWTHTRALSDAGLLERFVDGSVRYRATSHGRQLYYGLSELLTGKPSPTPRSHELAPGDEVDLVAALQRRAGVEGRKLTIKVRLEP